MSKTTKNDMVRTTPTENKIILIGEEAVDRLRKTFDHWMEIARALDVGRKASLRAAEMPEDTPRGEEGGGYNKYFNAWLVNHPKLRLSEKDSTDRSIRSWLYKCLDHENDIRRWRNGKGIVELTRFNFPETVFKRWAKDEDFVDPDAKPKRRGKKKDQKQKEDERELDYARREIKTLRDELGDWENEKPIDLAEKLMTSHPVEAEEVAHIILGDEDRTTINGIDWSVPKEDLIEMLFAIIPHNEKIAEILEEVAKRIRASGMVATEFSHDANMELENA